MIVSAQHYYVDTFIDVDQSRVAARRWLEEHTTSNDNVLVASELAFTPKELAQVPADVTRASLTDPGGTRDDADKFDYVVVGDFPSAAKWRDALRDRAMRTRFGSAPTPTDARGAGNGRNLTVRVFGSPGTRDVSECYPFCG
jgi:hypothetical protein